ncbi:Protein bicaudal C, partial [Gryllus bimaculatus]
MFADRVRVDRRRLEGLITGESEFQEAAQAFFDRLEEQTRTRILWPSHLKIGSRSRKSPHVHIAGLMEDVLQAKKEVMAILDSPDVRVTMKIDVSYLYHSHIIGRGGLVIKQVMEETGTHIHFPDSNRTSTTDKSSQVSLSGKLAGVEQARQRVRNLMPLVFLFDVPALGDAASGAECASPYVMRLQQQFNVQVRIRHRHRLNGVQVQVKGSELEVTHVTEATLFLIRHFCVNAGAADQVSVYTTLEIPPHHQPLVLGINCCNIKTIMNHTSTQIMVPDLNDPYIPQIKKNIITVLGPIRNVYLARQMLLGSLPILLLFEISDNTTVDFNSVAEIMYDLDVQISFRQKEKQKTFAVSIKGIERDASNVYEARRRLLGLEGHKVVAEVPATYFVPDAPPVFRHALGR